MLGMDLLNNNSICRWISSLSFSVALPRRIAVFLEREGKSCYPTEYDFINVGQITFESSRIFRLRRCRSCCAVRSLRSVQPRLTVIPLCSSVSKLIKCNPIRFRKWMAVFHIAVPTYYWILRPIDERTLADKSGVDWFFRRNSRSQRILTKWGTAAEWK